MGEFLSKLLDVDDFIPRRDVPGWHSELVWLHTFSDILIGLACIAISLSLVFLSRRFPVPRLFWVLPAVILVVGLTHLIEVVTFVTPLHRLSGLLKFLTALFSWAVVLALGLAMPRVVRWLDQLGGRARSPELSLGHHPGVRLRQYMVAILAAVLAVLVRLLFDPFLQSDHALVIPLLAVMAVAWYAGFGPAALTLVVSMTAVIYAFVSPRYSFLISALSDQLAVGMFLFCGVGAALLGEAQREARRRVEVHAAMLEAVNRELAQSQQEATAALGRYRLLTEAIPQIVWNADSDGRVSYVNTRWADYTGLGVDAARADGWVTAVHPDDAARVVSAWRATVEGRADRFSHEFRLRRSADDSYRWFLSVAVPLRRPDGTVDQWIGSLSDIDDHKRAAERLEEMVRDRTVALSRTNAALQTEVAERRRAEEREQAAGAELRRSNDELEKFAYVASHDLQEPLRKIQAFGDRLARRCRDEVGEQGRDYLDRMLASAGRMRRLIDDLLVFSRVATKPQAFAAIDLNEVVADVVADLEVRIDQAGGRVELGPLPAVNADPTQMRQLFQNLIGNALKFQSPGVPPLVQVSAAGWDTLPADADPPAPPGRGWRIRVTDNGIGFDQQFAERIFEVFQRLHGRDRYEGTGIGLAICRKIVERHGGGIAARGRPGEGATFVVDLPAGTAGTQEG